MKLFWEESLKKRLKIYGLILAIPVGLLLLIGLIGFVGDLIAKPQLNKMRKEALQYFEDFRNQGGYLKPVYNENVEEGNAWDFYAKAMEKIEKMDDEYRRDLDDFFWKGTNRDSTQLAALVYRSEQILDEARQGLKQKRYLSPIEYEKGLLSTDTFPNYKSLKMIVKLFASHGRFEQRAGRSQQAARDYLDAIRLGQDIAGGDLTFMGNVIGVVCIGIGIVNLKADLKTFSFEEEDLREISKSLHILSFTWPSLGESFFDENRLDLLTNPEDLEDHLRSEFPKYKDFIDSVYPSQSLHDRFVSWWRDHLRCWATLFSVKRAYVNSMTLYQEISKDVSKMEKRSWQELKLLGEEWEKDLSENPNCKKDLVEIILPHSSSRVLIRMEGILKLRLQGAAALTHLYYLRNQSYPSELNESDRGEMEDLFIDPMTGQPWKYKVFANGDSCEIYSPYI